MSSQLAEGSVESGQLLSTQTRLPGPYDDADPTPRWAIVLSLCVLTRRTSSCQKHVVSHVAANEEVCDFTNSSGNVPHALRFSVKQEAARKIRKAIKALLRNQRLGWFGLNLERVVEVISVQVQVVDRGKRSKAVEAHAEARISAQEHGFDPSLDSELRQDLRETQRRVWNKETMSKPQRTHVDEDDHLPLFAQAALPRHLKHDFFGVDFVEVELFWVEALLNVHYLLSFSFLCCSLHVQLSHEPVLTRDDPGRQVSQAVPEQSSVHTLRPLPLNHLVKFRWW